MTASCKKHDIFIVRMRRKCRKVCERLEIEYTYKYIVASLEQESNMLSTCEEYCLQILSRSNEFQLQSAI